MMLLHKKSGYIAFIFILIAIALSSTGLAIDPIYGGEWHSVRHTGIFESADSIAYTFNSVATTSPDHAPFYFVFMYHWVRLVGVHPIVLRALSLLAYGLGIAVAYRTGSLLLDRVGGVFTAFLMVASAYAVFYSHEIRMYIFMPSFSMAILYFYWSITSAKDQVRWHLWVGLFLASLLAVYVHYSSIFVLVSIGLYHLLIAPKNRRWVKIAIVEVLAGILFLPWLPVVLSGSERLAPLANSSLSFSDALYHMLFVHTNGLWFIGVGLILLALWSLRDWNPKYIYLVFVSLGTVLLLVLVNEFVATVLLVRRMRYTLIVLPLLSLVFSLGLLQLMRWRLSWLIVLGILMAWAGAGVWFAQSDEMRVYTNRESYRFAEYPPFHIAQSLLDDLPGFGEPVLSAHPNVDVELPILLFYSKWTEREFNHIFNEPDPVWIPRMINRLDIIEDDESFLMIYDPRVTDPVGIDLYSDIILAFKSCATLVDLPELHIDYYVRNHIPCSLVDDSEPVELEFENGIRLDNIELEQINDETYRIFTWWDREVDTSLPLSFTIQVVNEDGLPVLASDYYMPSKTIGFNDLDISSLQAGDYQLQLIIQNIESGEWVKSRTILTDTDFGEFSLVGEMVILE